MRGDPMLVDVLPPLASSLSHSGLPSLPSHPFLTWWAPSYPFRPLTWCLPSLLFLLVLLHGRPHLTRPFLLVLLHGGPHLTLSSSRKF